VIICSLNTPPRPCHDCGFSDFVKNGHKKSLIKALPQATRNAYLEISKQRYRCKNCGCSQTATTRLVDKNCYIGRNIKHAVLLHLQEPDLSLTRIAKLHNVSTTTVIRQLKALKSICQVDKNHLPEVLMVDEFRSMKSVDGAMSFVIADGITGDLIDVKPDRRLQNIVKYFMSYSTDALKNVKYLVTDMNAPYFTLVKKCFPNAQVVVDRFHIVQHINRSLNNFRIRIMKQFDDKSPEYKQLKALWRLILKKPRELDNTIFYSWPKFKREWLTQQMAVDRLLKISPELEEAYWFTHQLTQAFDERNHVSFFETLLAHKHLPVEFHNLQKTFKKYRKGIELAFETPYSNGKIENLNLRIKNLKRVAYGFRNWTHFKTKIHLLGIHYKITKNQVSH
jgi:transposase